MKIFLTHVNDMIGQLSYSGRYEIETVQRMQESYKQLSREAQLRSITLLDEILKEEAYYYYIMSSLLVELKDENIAFCIGNMLTKKDLSLWERNCMLFQLKAALFGYEFLYHEEYRKHQMMQTIYENLMEDIKEQLGVTYKYIPFGSRNKVVVLVVWQLLGIMHAPTRKAVDIYNYLKRLGYEVKIYVCFWDGASENGWYKQVVGQNFCKDSVEFRTNIEGTIIEGYNCELKKVSFIHELRNILGRIWDEKPEWILELGGGSIVADLCQEFTTVVAMNCTKVTPITRAPIVARYFSYSREEDEFFKKCLNPKQEVIDVPHEIQGIEKKNRVYQKSDFGISEDEFVIIMAGNRLESELNENFLEMLYSILKENKKIAIAVIGNCGKWQKEIEEGEYKEQIFFLGYQENFREVIAMGDVFLNTPRKGGGTGGLFAILEQVPVVTLNDCDVESICGKEFVCGSVDEIPALIHKYYSEQEFMKKQREYCKINAKKFMNVDSVGSFKKLCELIKGTTLEKERLNES